ncbi:MAG: benzoate-CoA ligase family protein [Chloroflexi bacterium]|nr:benzoate-CoA ligase family protein [Chloroflexota bacterium]
MDLFNASEYLVDRQVAAGNGDRVAIRCRGESITYAGLLQRVEMAASGLRRLGVRPEERVVLVLLDGPEFVAAFLGAMRIGAVPLPLNPLLPGADLALSAADARARIAIVSAERAATALPGLAGGAPELTDVVATGAGAESPGRVRIHRWDDALAAGAADSAPYATWADSPGFWLCTSGTTGRPKLAMHRHADIRLTAEGYAREVLTIVPEDRCYSVAPMFHAYGLGNSMVFPFSVGATAILEPTRPPTPALVASVVTAEEPTLFFSVPTAYGALLAAELPAGTFRSVRQAVSAGESLPGEFFTRFHERFGVEILDGIGSTELTHIFISNRNGAARPGTSGTPVGGYRVQLQDDGGHVLPPGSTGHLFVSGDTAATGYWCRADASRQTFRGEWLRTGDMYASSDDGFYSYLGRSDDMLKVGGEWVSPAEVEGVLLEDPAVVEVAVIGEATAEGLMQPVAYVVAAEGQAIDEASLVAHCKARLAGYKRPRRIVVLPELPKTATGKIQRAQLRERPRG